MLAWNNDLPNPNCRPAYQMVHLSSPLLSSQTKFKERLIKIIKEINTHTHMKTAQWMGCKKKRSL
jgi:hypothetical protein